MDLSNVSFTIQNGVVIGISGIPSSPTDWQVHRGSYQVALVNYNLDMCIKIPNYNNGDSIKLIYPNNLPSTRWRNSGDENLPIVKYTSSQIKKLYALLLFHYENGIGPNVGRIFDVDINGDTYFAFEVQRLEQKEWWVYIRETMGLDDNAINTWVYDYFNKPGGIVELYKSYDALNNYENCHIIRKDEHDTKRFSIDYKAEHSIFFVDNNMNPLCYDVDIHDISNYFKHTFIDNIVKKYSGIIEERNFSDYL